MHLLVRTNAKKSELQLKAFKIFPVMYVRTRAVIVRLKCREIATVSLAMTPVSSGSLFSQTHFLFLKSVGENLQSLQK